MLHKLVAAEALLQFRKNMTDDINPIESDFNAALSRYQDGQELIPIAQDFQKNHSTNTQPFCCLDLSILVAAFIEE